MRTLSASDTTLVIQSPAWVGIAVVVLALGLTAIALLRRPPRVARLGAFLGTIALLYAGWNVLFNRVTFEPRGFILVEGIYGEEERVGWLGVAGVDTKSQPGHIVFHLRNSREVALDLSDLSDADQARVATFARARLSR